MSMLLRRPRRLELAWARWLVCLVLVVPSFSLPADTGVAAVSAAPECQSGGHSPKKGLGIGTTGRYPDWKQRLTRLNVAWFYTWRAHYPGRVSESVEFVPMVWGPGGISEENLADLRKGKANGLYRNLLAFNEPDAEAQANISADDAVKLWSKLVSTKLRLGSPATLNPHNLWMRTFVSGVEQERQQLDFIAMHWYGGPSPKKFLLHLEYVHRRYGRPIWITEFAIADWEARTSGVSRFSSEQAISFMKAVIPALNCLDYVERYAWFSPSPDSAALSQSALFNHDGSLTPLGHVYAGY